jgi:hypothetical protein
MGFSPGLKSSFVNIIWAFDSPGSLETAALLRSHLIFDMMPGSVECTGKEKIFAQKYEKAESRTRTSPGST